MDFLKEYIKFCTKHKMQNIANGYTSSSSFEKRPKGIEIHHVLPKCAGGSKRKFRNLVLLSFEDHVVAHLLLQLALLQHKRTVQAKRHCLKSILTYKQFTAVPLLKKMRFVMNNSQKGDHSWTLLQMLTSVAINCRGDLSTVSGRNKAIATLQNWLNKGVARVASKGPKKTCSFGEIQQAIAEGMKNAMAEAERKAHREKAKLAKECIQIALSRDFMPLDLKRLEEIRNHTSVPMQVPAESVQVSKAEAA